jgi:hypothetical protein
MPIPLPDGFEVSWAGPLPVGRLFCLGSEDGRLLFTKENGAVVYGPSKVSPSSSAINGVAISGFWLAASTREEVSFMPIRVGEKQDSHGLAFPHGAHGIDVTPSGYFIAPLGRTGIMTAAPPFALGESIIVHGDEKGDFYSYRVACLRAADGSEVLVVAARGRGLGFTPFPYDDPTHLMSTASLDGLEVVDCCPLLPGTDSMAVAALGRDRRLFLFRDILTDKNPMTLHFRTLTGTGCRVLSSRGDLYVVTSNGIHMVHGLAAQLMGSTAADTVDTRILVLEMEVVDANLCGDEWMLVVRPDGVLRFDVRALHESGLNEVSGEYGRESLPVNVTENWKWSHIAQSSVQLELAT